MSNLKTVTLLFDEQPLLTYQIPNFRSQVIALFKKQHDLLHNYSAEGKNLQRHSLVHYRTLNGKAMLYGMNEGADLLMQLHPLLQAEFGKIWIATEPYQIEIAPKPIEYAIQKYLPLNTNNKAIWTTNTSLSCHLAQIEKLIQGHLLGICKLANYHVPVPLTVNILKLDELGPQQIKGGKGIISHLAFDVKFEVNLHIPSGIAIGKQVAKGFGIVNLVKSRIAKPAKNHQYHAQNTENTTPS